MVTPVTSMGRSGLSDWFMQRVTAVILLAYVLYVAAVVIFGDVSYSSWSNLFSQTWMRVFSLLALVSLGIHAWVGLWSVFTDYFTERMMGSAGNIIRLAAQVVSGIIMFTYLVWGIQILWGL